MLWASAALSGISGPPVPINLSLLQLSLRALCLRSAFEIWNPVTPSTATFLRSIYLRLSCYSLFVSSPFRPLFQFHISPIVCQWSPTVITSLHLLTIYFPVPSPSSDMCPLTIIPLLMQIWPKFPFGMMLIEENRLTLTTLNAVVEQRRGWHAILNVTRRTFRPHFLTVDS